MPHNERHKETELHMMLQHIFKLLHHNCCQQQAYTEDYQPACASPCYVKYALPPAGHRQQSMQGQGAGVAAVSCCAVSTSCS